MRIGFIGLGSAGGNLAGTLLRNGVDLTVLDLDAARVADFVARGARAGTAPAEMLTRCGTVITCLPSPKASAAVVEGPGGLLEAMGEGRIWLEMSTTDEAEVKRLNEKIVARGGRMADVAQVGAAPRLGGGGARGRRDPGRHLPGLRGEHHHPEAGDRSADAAACAGAAPSSC